jgi:hypothetical protein
VVAAGGLIEVSSTGLATIESMLFTGENKSTISRDILAALFGRLRAGTLN